MGGAALAAIPTLVNRVEQGDQQAEDALARVCKGAGDGAVPALTNALTGRNPKLREKAAEILGEIGPPAKAAIPLLRQRLNDPQPKVMAWSAMSLRKIDGHGEGAVPVLVNLLTNPLPDMAIPKLTVMAQGEEVSASWGMDALSAMGSNAHPFWPRCTELPMDAADSLRRGL